MNFIRVNRAYAEQDGQAPGYFSGEDHFELYPNEENEAIFRRVLRTGEPAEFYAKPFTYAAHPQRGVSYWDWSLHAVKNEAGQSEGLLLCLVDVTQRERAEAQARQHQAELAPRGPAQHDGRDGLGDRPRAVTSRCARSWPRPRRRSAC